MRLKLDAEGAGGNQMATRFAGVARSVQQNPERAFEFYPVRSSLPALSRMMYGTIRDELYANFVTWLQGGGALPPDPKLEAEIHFGEWQSVQIGAAMDRRTVWKAPARTTIASD